MMDGKNNNGAVKAPDYNIFVNFDFSENIRQEVGEACARFRRDYGWSQQWVQRILNVDAIIVSKFENGEVIKSERFYWFYISKMLEMNDLSYLEEVFNVEGQ